MNNILNKFFFKWKQFIDDWEEMNTDLTLLSLKLCCGAIFYSLQLVSPDSLGDHKIMIPSEEI